MANWEHSYELAGLEYLRSQTRDGIKPSPMTKISSIWDHAEFSEYKARDIRISTESVQDEKRVEEGYITCTNPKCRSKRCRYWSSQDRSADEAETIHFVCSICGRRDRLG